MISPGQWHDNGDGTAWAVSERLRDITGSFVPPDRLCDHCNGTGLNNRRMVEVTGPCDCINGRHTFTIEVNPTCGHPIIERDTQWEDHERRCNPSTYRVSVVPGMVLPIVAADLVAPARCIIIDDEGRSWLVDENGETPITLPPDAKPGMWAVLVNVARS